MIAAIPSAPSVASAIVQADRADTADGSRVKNTHCPPSARCALDPQASGGHYYECSSGSSSEGSEALQPQLPRSGPDGQPIESSHLAKKFEEAARGQYQVVREDEVADKKETDIRLLSRGSGDRAVIEIKVGDSWTVKQLEETITGQLLGLYMRHESCRAGCLLVTYAGRKGFKRPGTNAPMTFSEVIDHLKAMAKNVEEANGGKYLITVVGLDLRSPLPSDKLPSPRKK